MLLPAAVVVAAAAAAAAATAAALLAAATAADLAAQAFMIRCVLPNIRTQLAPELHQPWTAGGSPPVFANADMSRHSDTLHHALRKSWQAPLL